MLVFIVRRLLWAIPVLFFVALVSFFLMHQAPGGPFDKDNSKKQVDGATLKALNARFGLDKPQYLNPGAVSALWQKGERNPLMLGRAYFDSQFGNYLINALRGDLGPSYRQRGKSVQDILLKQWPFSLRLGLLALGVRQHQILLRHLLPNSLGPIIIAGAFIVPGAIIAEAVLSYLGIGLRPATNPNAIFPVSWGTMILDGKSAIVAQPWLLIAPAVAIASITLAFTFLGDGLRDALDPRDQ